MACVSPKKVVHQTYGNSFLNGFSFFFHCDIIVSTIPSVCCCTTLRKLEVRVLAYLEENANENITCNDF